MSFELMGKAPIRFKYTEDALEASWTFSPGDPELSPKLQRMLDFLRGRANGDGITAALAMESPVVPVKLTPPALPESAVANGWEMYPNGEE